MIEHCNCEVITVIMTIILINTQTGKLYQYTENVVGLYYTWLLVGCEFEMLLPAGRTVFEKQSVQMKLL